MAIKVVSHLVKLGGSNEVFLLSVLPACLDIQDMWNTLLYPAVTPDVTGLESISILLIVVFMSV